MSTILLVRHGQASFGDDNYDRLSQLGVIQAKLLGEYYGALQRPIHEVISGTLNRQVDSAQLFYDAYNNQKNSNQRHHSQQSRTPQDKYEPRQHSVGLALEHSDVPKKLKAFNEFYHEDIFMQSDPTFVDKAYVKALIAKAPNSQQYLAELFNKAMLRWYSNEYADDYFESWQAFYERIHIGLDVVVSDLIVLKDRMDQTHNEFDSSIAKLNTVASNLSKATDPTIMVFTSGGVIATITAQLMGGDSLLAYQLNQALVNCGVTTLSVNANNEMGLRSFNEHSHLLAHGINRLTRR